ncbi:MAG TPA: hypothetical protein VE988_06650 [Gemmataceae bacterium]|nr:hypothetical protein [Gemmataceae bacterium]
MVRIALLGAALAGTYGALHDQISYSISPEYFTKMKFFQFSWADFGWPPRVFASEVGFLATWWVGLFGGWFVARAGLDEMPQPQRRRTLLRAFAIVFTVAPLFGLTGALIGVARTHYGDLSGWAEIQYLFDLQDLPGFIIVAYLHVAGYLGAAVGLVLAVVYVRRVAGRLKNNACGDE